MHSLAHTHASSAEVSSYSSLVAGLPFQGVRWCLLRDAGALDGDIDLLVDPRQIHAADALLRGADFVKLPSLGRGTHRFFVRFSPESGEWITLDVVTELAFGPGFELHTAKEQDCLARRRLTSRGYELDHDDAFWALLFHCLLDKQSISPRRRGQLSELAASATGEGPLGRMYAELGPAEWTHERVLTAARHGHWNSLEDLRRPLRRTWRRREGFHGRRRVASSTLLRILERPVAAIQRRGITVAILGLDGAGKSTLIAGLQTGSPLPVRSVYMGLWKSGGLLDRTPLLRPFRIIARPVAAWRRYIIGQWHRALGRVVLFDRYTYDPYLPPKPPLVGVKTAYLRFLAATCPAPDLVLLLDVPADIAIARKDEEDRADLERTRDLYLALGARLRNLRIIDATRAADVVRAESLRHIWDFYRSRPTQAGTKPASLTAD
jgi:thymidylate kinase